MDKEKSNDLSVLLSLFADSITPEDIISTKLMSQISSAIVKERLKLHMTQAEFAKHINVSQALVSRCERGNCNFSLKKVAEIASTLNLDVNISFCNASLKLQSKSLDYTTPATFTKTVCYQADAPSYSSKSYISTNSNRNIIQTIQKQEVYHYATVR